MSYRTSVSYTLFIERAFYLAELEPFEAICVRDLLVDPISGLSNEAQKRVAGIYARSYCFCRSPFFPHIASKQIAVLIDHVASAIQLHSEIYLATAIRCGRARMQHRRMFSYRCSWYEYIQQLDPTAFSVEVRLLKTRSKRSKSPHKSTN